MFKRKYNTSILDSKWVPIKRNLKLTFIPRKDEYIWYVDKYYLVVNIIYTLNKEDEILIIVEETQQQPTG